MDVSCIEVFNLPLGDLDSVQISHFICKILNIRFSPDLPRVSSQPSSQLTAHSPAHSSQLPNSGTPDLSIRTSQGGGLEGGALKTQGKRDVSGRRLWELIYATPQQLSRAIAGLYRAFAGPLPGRSRKSTLTAGGSPNRGGA